MGEINVEAIIAYFEFELWKPAFAPVSMGWPVGQGAACCAMDGAGMYTVGTDACCGEDTAGGFDVVADVVDAEREDSLIEDDVA